MRFPWKRVTPADEAIEKAKRNLAETKGKWEAVNHVAAKAEDQIRRNHFAPTIARALGDHR